MLWLAGMAAAAGVLSLTSMSRFQWYSATLLVTSVAACAAACLVFWRSQCLRTLVWDGERWSLKPSEPGVVGEARAQVWMDIQCAMLIGLKQVHARRCIWLWAEAAHDPVRWHLLRCALYSSALSAADDPPVDEYA
jgi:hypothetical protein